MAVVDDRGFFLTLQAVSRQLAAMPNQLYLVRLIHHATRRALPGERLWTATQLVNPVTVRFLRARNRDGCDVYVLPYAGPQNAGYILVDLDGATPTVVETMRAHGHAPCLVVQTSPGHLQTWIRLSATPLEPALATAAGKQLARAYGGDLASSDWRHLGRLVGFTNQKPARRTPGGYAPWVKIVYAHPGLAPCADTLLHSLLTPAALTPPPLPVNTADFPSCAASPSEQTATSTHPSASEAVEIYSRCVNQWRIRERFPHPDWSIVDLWVARHLLSLGTPVHQVRNVVRLASPHFPRRHADPDDYLRRTVAYALAFPFPRARRALCATHREPSAAPAVLSACSNSTGGR
jgi:RepB DNA-primase from phage plasmid